VALAEGDVGSLDRWIGWAQRSRLLAFVELARPVRGFCHAIVATMVEHISNALVESVNTKMRSPG
jgi:transposase